MRRLTYILEKPTPFKVTFDKKDKKLQSKNNNGLNYLTNLSILKSCPLFENTKAAENLYKIAKLVPHIDFEDYICSWEDLDWITENMTPQFYIPIFNRFGENHHTK